MIFDAVVFDLDGVLVDSEPLYREAWQHCCRELNFGLRDDDYLQLLGRSDEECERWLVERLGGCELPEGFSRRRQRLWRDLVVRTGVPPKRGAKEALNLLDVLDLPYAVATSATRPQAMLVLASSNLLPRLATVVTADDVARSKPAPDLYLEATRRLGVQPARCLAIEDSEPGLEAAIQSGMKVVVVPDLQPISLRAQAAALMVLPSLDALSAALQPSCGPKLLQIKETSNGA